MRPSLPHSLRRHKKWPLIATALLLIILSLVAARLYLNVWVKDYVNAVLDNIPGYSGSVADVDIDLYRGAYRVHQLTIVKDTGNIPVPFVDIETVDFSVQWGALLHGRIVSDVELARPVINFAVSKNGDDAQTGTGVDWSKPIRDMMPIDINLVTFRDGKLTYRDFSATPQIHIYIRNMSGEAHNLRNVVEENQRLPSALRVTGNSIGNGKLDISGKVNILKPFPDMDLNLKLEKVHLPALSEYTRAHAAVDIEEGRLDAYSEVIVRDGRLSGYVKPIATGVALIDLRESNPLKLVWETVVAAVVEIFSNQPRDQFATRIPLEGNLNDIEGDTWAALAGIVRNAFIEAFHKGFDRDLSPESETP